MADDEAVPPALAFAPATSDLEDVPSNTTPPFAFVASRSCDREEDIDQESDDVFIDDLNDVIGSWNANHVGETSCRRGSMLRRSNPDEERGDHLQRLVLKRCLREEVLESDEAVDSAVHAHVLTRGILSQQDEVYIDELRTEVKQEVVLDMESANIREINRMIGAEYQEYFRQRNEFPLEVRLRNVSYAVLLDDSDQPIKTVYNTSIIYPLAQSAYRIYKGEPLRTKPAPRSKEILSNINLRLQAGKQYLVLGPPSCGKTTLLRAIASRLHSGGGANAEGCGLHGEISYNGKTLQKSNEFCIKNAFAFIDQLDNHAPRLTVKETLEFAYRCTRGGLRLRKMMTAHAQELMKRADQEHLATRLTLAGLGLTEVQDTFVGNADVRGVSGGQRRRVTVGEMLISGAPVLVGDEISTGLDAASTFDMIEIILYRARQRKQSSVISLLQPSPETVSLFDDVIVLAEGQIIYAGPIELVEDYFAGIGFQSPDFMDVADFLQLVSTQDGSTLYKPDDVLKLSRPDPPSVSELAHAFRESALGIAMFKELDVPWSVSWPELTQTGTQLGTEACKPVASETIHYKYANFFPKSTELIFWRFIVLWLRDRHVIIAGTFKCIAMGVSVGGVFVDTDDAFSIQGALFQAGLFIMLGTLKARATQGASGLIVDRVIFYKHSMAANFYSAFPFVVGRTLAQLPQTMTETVTFASILYYMIGLADRTDPGNFFVYLSILITFAILMNAQLAIFATFASAGQVQVYSSCTLLAMMLFGGFIIPPNAIPRYFLWLYWWNPFAWAYRALIVNEFRSRRWLDAGQVLAEAGFVHDGRPYGREWVGWSFAYMLSYFMLCCFISTACLTRAWFGDEAARTSALQSSTLTTDELGHQNERKKLEAAFKPVTLSFSNLCYTVKSSTSKAQLTLLHNVNGVFRPGRMCALMGSSGAGKTTLMEVISLRKNTGAITGEVRVNGWPQSRAAFRRCAGYVEQFDVQSPELTVRETVLFSARLRLDSSLADSDETIRLFADNILQDVELTELADALIGSEDTQGLSFEQRKRLSIAVELAASPSIIFLDEPTSGLDARSAQLIVKTLRRIADDMRTVCATIHQPSSSVFATFDDLLLLKKGGNVVYHGPLGENCCHLVNYFESRGAPPILLGENPANWMLRVITTHEPRDLAESYFQSDMFKRLEADLEKLRIAPVESERITYDSEFASSGVEMRNLVNRRLRLIYWRSPSYNLARLMVSLLIACVLGSVFIFNRDKQVFSEVDVRARVSVIFIAFIITGIMAIMSALPVMLKIRDMFYRHRDAGMYDSYSIDLALGVAEKPFILTSTALFCAVFLSSADFGNGLRSNFAFWGFFTFNFAIYSYMGQLFVCLVKSTSTATVLASVYIGLNNFFAGLIARPQFLISGFYAVPYYICPGHYVYESLVTTVFHGDSRPVLANVGSEFFEYLADQDENDCSVRATECIGTVHEFVGVFFGHQYSKENNLRNALILGGVLTLTRALTLVALKYIRFST